MNTPFTFADCKSYATRKNLETAIEKLGFSELPRLVARNDEGRWTAAFFGPDANPVIFHGFKWVFGWDKKPSA
jgi:hypothetical protein